MIYKPLIKLLMIASPLMERMGLNPAQLRTILYTKCTVDDRQPSGIGSRYGRKKKGSSSWATNLILFVFGLLMAFTLVQTDEVLLGFSIFYSIFMIYVIVNLITNYSDILIDTRDHYLIMSRPVNDKTVSVARILHLLIHISQMLLPLTVPALILVLIRNGAAPGGIFFIGIIFATIISVFLVNIIYLLMLQLMRPEKFKDLLAYVQVVFTIAIFAGYHFFPRLTNFVKTHHINITDYSLSYFLPPVWLAGMQAFGAGIFNASIYLFTALAILAPALCMMVVVKFLSRNYGDKLSLMGAATQQAKSSDRAAEITKENTSISDTLSRWVTSSPLEQLGFRITWKLTSRIRAFKVRVYPTLGYLPIYFVYFAFTIDSDMSWGEKWHQLPQTSYYLFILYALIFISTSLLIHVTRSNQYQAAWFYKISPHKHPGHVLLGSVKAMVVKFELPLAIVATAFILYVWGLSVVLNIALALIILLLVTIITAFWQVDTFPFSQPIDREKQKGRAFKNFFYLIIPMAIGFGHYMISNYTWVIAALLILFSGLSWYLFGKYKQKTWADLR